MADLYIAAKCFDCRHCYSKREISFRDLLKGYDKVIIPSIQRDYAQGRRDDHATEVREHLLESVFSSNNLKFDIIYGTEELRKDGEIEERCFVPLDGQQRLTTLFLLYVYQQKLLPCEGREAIKPAQEILV